MSSAHTRLLMTRPQENESNIMPNESHVSHSQPHVYEAFQQEKRKSFGWTSHVTVSGCAGVQGD